MKLLTQFLDLLFPPRCAFCGSILRAEDSCVCVSCCSSLPFSGKNSKSADDFGRFDLCVSPFYYEGSVREAILRFKFKNRRAYAACFGKLLARCVLDELQGGFDIITWVPVSPERKRQRGYDQAKLLCEAAARELGGAALPVLKKTRDAPPQPSLHSVEARRKNAEGAFAAASSGSLKGKRVLLIDDILTTGATLSAAATALKASGVREVVCATLAKTQPERKKSI